MSEPVRAGSVAKAVADTYRELTPAAMILGIIQGVILNLAFVYAALKLGFSIGGSTVAAITGYAVLRGVMRKGTIIENNINQTIASGINTAGTGVVFTIPALFMLREKWASTGGPTLDFSPWPLLVGGVAGAILGVVLIIPLRKQMIDLDRLRFPTGVAVSTILRSGSTGLDKAKLLLIGFVLAAGWKFLMAANLVPGVVDEEIGFSFGVIPSYLSPVLYLSLMNFAAGLLSGKGGLPFFAGGILSWWIISPAAVQLDWIPATIGADDMPGYIYSKMLRPLGIGTLIGGALMGVVVAFPAIRSAIRSLAMAAKTAGAGGSNWSPTSDMVRERGTALVAAHGATPDNPLPADLATASGAGLDPHVSEAAALYQAARVAEARGVPIAQVEALIRGHATSPGAFLTGDRIVNVLEVNLALDRM